MTHAVIIKLDFFIHELNNGMISPSSKKNGKSIGIIYGNSVAECREKIDELIKSYNLKIIEENNE